VAFVTDSIGANPDGTSTGKYPAIFADMLDVSGKAWEAIPHGWGGATVAPCCFFLTLQTLTNDLLDEHAGVLDAVVLQAGTNDASRGQDPQEVIDTLLALQAQIQEATVHGEKKAGVWVALIHHQMPLESYTEENALIDEYNALIEANFSARLIDIPSVVTEADYIDAKHLTPEAQLKVARLVYETLVGEAAPY
jgi:lysophospholipase L1-like esterase